MLADGVEASVRSLASRDEPAIRAMVARIIEERIDDGQFDECDLTLRDLERIREAFVAQLLGMYHTPDRLPAEHGRRARVAPRRGRRRAAAAAAGAAARHRDPGDLPGPVAGRPDRPRRRRARRSRGAALARAIAAALDAAGAPRAGLDRADPVRRRRAGRLNADAPRQDGPDRRPVVPAAAAGGVPAASRAASRSARRSSRPASPCRPVAVAPRRHRRLGRAGDRAGRGGPRRPDRRRPLVAGRRAAPPRRPTARSTSAAGTTPSRPRRRRCAPSRRGCSPADAPGRTAVGRTLAGAARCYHRLRALPERDRALSCCPRRILGEGRRRSREPRVAVRADAPQHRLAGDGPPRRSCRLDGQGPPARRLQRRHGPLPRPRPDARQAADVHERFGAGGPQGPRPRARPAGRPPGRRRRLRAAVRQAALPRGRRRGRPQRPALDHRRARTEKFSRLRVGIGEPGPERRRPRPDEVRARRAAAPRRAARRRGRRGRGLGARGDQQGGQPLQHVRAAPGRHDAARRRRRGRRAARTPTASAGRGRAGGGSGRRKRTPDACPTPPLRGRRGRDRRIAERVATDFAARHAPPSPDDEVDFDVAAVDAEVEDARRAPPKHAAGRAAPTAGATPARTGAAEAAAATACPTCPRCRRSSPRPARSRPCASASGRRRATTPRRAGRHVGLVSVPHGAKTYLAAALALGATASGSSGSPATRRSATASPRSSAPGSATRRPSPSSSRGPRWPTSAASSIADETAARVAALAAWRSGRARVLVASVQALLQHTIAPGRPAATRRASCGSGRGSTRTRCCASCSTSATCPVTRGRRSGRVRRAAAGSSTSSRRRCRCPIRIEFFGDEIDSLRVVRPDRPADDRPRSSAPSCCPASEFLLPAGGAAAIRERLGRAAGATPGAARRRPRPLRHASRCDGRPRARPRRAARAGRRRRGRGLGRPPRPGDRPRPHRSGHAARARRAGRHRRGGRLPVAPGRRAARRAGRGRRAAEGLAVDLPAAARLEEPARRRRGPSS